MINSGEITGMRGLAAAVIGVAVKDGDEAFFRTDDGQFWADVAELDLAGLQRVIPDVGKS